MEPRTSRLLTRLRTFMPMSEERLPLEANFISVTRKFLHLFTFSMVCCLDTQFKITEKEGKDSQAPEKSL